jgi:hypothetical protein
MSILGLTPAVVRTCPPDGYGRIGRINYASTTKMSIARNAVVFGTVSLAALTQLGSIGIDWSKSNFEQILARLPVLSILLIGSAHMGTQAVHFKEFGKLLEEWLLVGEILGDSSEDKLTSKRSKGVNAERLRNMLLTTSLVTTVFAIGILVVSINIKAMSCFTYMNDT